MKSHKIVSWISMKSQDKEQEGFQTNVTHVCCRNIGLQWSKKWLSNLRVGCFFMMYLIFYLSILFTLILCYSMEWRTFVPRNLVFQVFWKFKFLILASERSLLSACSKKKILRKIAFKLCNFYDILFVRFWNCQWITYRSD